MRNVFDCIYGLLMVPDSEDSLDSNLALVAYSDPESYAAMVRPEGVERSKTRAHWAAEFEEA